MLYLNDDDHKLVKQQLQSMEWAGTNGQFCPGCGGARPKDKIDRNGTPLPDGRLPMISGVFQPAPDEGHLHTCSLAAAIITVSSPDRIVVFCQTGDPKGFEEGKS